MKNLNLIGKPLRNKGTRFTHYTINNNGVRQEVTMAIMKSCFAWYGITEVSPGDSFNKYLKRLQREFPDASLKMDYEEDLGTSIFISVKGKAIQHPQDAYNEVIGKDVARSKAKIRTHVIVKRIILSIQEWLERDLKDQLQISQAKIEKEKRKIKEV